MSKFQINVHSEFAQNNSKQNNPNQNKTKPTDFQKKNLNTTTALIVVVDFNILKLNSRTVLENIIKRRYEDVTTIVLPRKCSQHMHSLFLCQSQAVF